MDTCLVTGVAGFVGSHLAERLLAEGYDVFGVDCFTDHYPRSLKEANLQRLSPSPGFRFFPLDLRFADLRPLLSGVAYILPPRGPAGRTRLVGHGVRAVRAAQRAGHAAAAGSSQGRWA